MRWGIAMSLLCMFPVIAASQGHFFDGCGNYLGNDGKEETRFYVIKTTKWYFMNKPDTIRSAGITEEEAEDVMLYIRTYSGITKRFKDSARLYTYFQELIASARTRENMYEIISKDQGITNTTHTSNREYGGYVKKNGVVIEAKDTVASPLCGIVTKVKIGPSEDALYEFHTHPSGYCINSEQHKTYYSQPPSPTDTTEVKRRIGYIFGRRDNTVYVYNNKGVLATIPLDRFMDMHVYVSRRINAD